MEPTIYESRIFALNMETCAKFRPELFELIKGVEDSGRYSMFSSDEDSGIYNLLDNQEQKLYYELSDPIGSIAGHIETCINKLQGIMVCLGFGLGYGPLMLVKQSNYVSRAILVVEPDPEVVLLAFKSLDCRAIIESEDVLMCVDYSVEEVGIALQKHILSGNRLINAKNVQIIDLPASLSVHGEYYLSTVKKVKDTIYEAVKFVGNCPNDAMQGLDNTLANLTHHISLPGVRSLKGLFAGKPGVVVASGPSLDKNVHLLEEINDKAIIASADASLGLLLKRNLKPHFVSCIERIEATAALFEGLIPEHYKDVHMVASPVVHPKSFENYQGPIIATRRESLFFNAFDFDKGNLEPGPSAGNMAFRLLNYLGCDPIILIGQDLALSEEGKTHARDNPYGDEQSVYLHSPEEIEGNYCKTLKTNPILKMFLYGYQSDVANFKGKVVNATEGGAKIPGTQLMTLREAIDTYIKTPLEFPNAPNLSIAEYIASSLEQPSEAQISEDKFRAEAAIRDAIDIIIDAGNKIDSAKQAAIDFEQSASIEASDEDKSLKRDKVLAAMDEVSALTLNAEFRTIAMDVLSAVFFHTMAEYVRAIAVTEIETDQDKELVRNVENLTNNFEVLLLFVKQLYSEHLSRIEGGESCGTAQTLFKRESNDFSITAMVENRDTGRKAMHIDQKSGTDNHA